MPQAQQLIETTVSWLLSHGLRILVIVVLVVVAVFLARRIISRVFRPLVGNRESEMAKRAQTLRSLVGYTANITLIVVGVIAVLSELGINIGPVLAAAGIVGVAVGFGSQQLVQDVISGFFMLMEDQIRVGDVIETGGRSGVVEGITLRTTKLRDLAGNVHFVRNGGIDVVTNMTKEFSFYVFDVGVAYREDVDEVIEVLRGVDAELRADPDYQADILAPLEVLGLDRFDDSAVVVKARTKTRPGKQWRMGREFNRRLKLAFDARQIEIPFPHVVVYAGQGKDGTAPALPVAVATGARPV